MILIYLEVILKYIKKMFVVYLFMIITIIMTLILVFTPIVVVKSQSMNIRNYLNKYKTNYDAIAKDINKSQLEKIEKGKNIKLYYNQKDLGTFKDSNNDIKYTLKTFNKNIFEMEKYTIIKGNYPSSVNEIIVSENSNLKESIGKYITGVITKDIEENNIHKKINKKDSFKVVGVYKRNTKTQEIINKLQVDYSEDILTNKNFNFPGEDRYNLYLVFKRDGRSISSMVYEISKKILGENYDVVQSNQLSEKINDSFINATDDAIRMFKPIIISGSLIIFLIYLLVFEDRRRMLTTIETLGGQKKKIVFSMIIENSIIMLTTVLIGTIIGIVISKNMVKGTDLTGFVADLNISDKKLYVSHKDIINSSLVSFVSLITITIYEGLSIYKLNILKVIGSRIKLPKILIKRKKESKITNSKNYALKISYDYFKSSFNRYIIPVVILSMFGSLAIGFCNIEKNDKQFSKRTKYDQINKYHDYSLINNGYLGDEKTILNNSNFNKNISNVIKEYNSNGYICVDTKNLNSDYKEILNLSGVDISNYELNTYFRGLSDEDISRLKKQNVLANEDIKVLNKGGLILINGFYYRNMAINIKIFNNNPRKIDLKYIEYNNDEEQYKNKTINDIVVHEYSEKYKVVNPELEYPMVIMKDSLLKNLTNINQPTNIYFNVQNNNSEKYINNILENNTKYIVFNAKYYKQKNKSTSAILYTGVKKINIFILFLFSVITMMFTIKLTIIYREKDIHTLRAVGASNKHILSLFINEGLILGLICCVISILIGIKNGYVNYSRYLGEQINKEKIHFIVNYSSIVVCVLIILILSITFQIIYLKNRNKSTVSDN